MDSWIDRSVGKYVKYEVNVIISDSVRWYIEKSVNDVINIDRDGGVDIIVDVEVERDIDEEVELKVEGEDIYENASIVYRNVKYDVNMVIDDIVCWNIDINVGTEVGRCR